MVDGTLQPYLESEFDFQLLLHERDFPGGVTIIENIIQAVQRSRRMIMLLTRSVTIVALRVRSPAAIRQSGELKGELINGHCRLTCVTINPHPVVWGPHGPRKD